MSEIIKNYHSQSMNGMVILASIFQAPDEWPALLSGEKDELLKCAFHTIQSNQNGTSTKEVTVDQVNSATVLEAVEDLKNGIRGTMQEIIGMAAKDVSLSQEQAIRKVRHLNRVDIYGTPRNRVDIHTPSKHGTVDEISAKYNISKKLVRQMKRDGKLDAFIAEQAQQ